MRPLPRPAAGIVLALVVAAGGHAAAQTGDALCDPRQSTADTCVIAAAASVPDGTTLTFTASSVVLGGTLAVQASGSCTLTPGGPCASDADCVAPARCDR